MKKQLSLLMSSSLLAVGAVTALALDAAALTPGVISCSTSNLAGSSACEGAFTGNNSNQDLDGLFGVADWGEELFKIEEGDPTSNGPLTVETVGDTSGTWSIDESFLDMTETLMFVLKGGPSFSAYLWNGVDTSGTWNTDGVQTGGRNPKAGPDLSHFSIYRVPRKEEPEPNPIPEPAAMVGLVMVGAGIVTSRRKKAEQV